MLLLQLYLLFGLVLHKIIWEVLKQKADEKPKEIKTLKLIVVKTIKITILLAVIIQIFLPEILPITNDSLTLRVIGTIIYTIGLATAIGARFQLGTNWANIETGQVLEKQNVVAQGIYGFIRHPIYTGDLLLLFGLELALNSWLVLGILLLAPVVMQQAIKEEKMLIQSLSGYSDYCGQTKRFIPFVI